MTFRSSLAVGSLAARCLAPLLTLACGDDAPSASPWAGQTFLLDVPAESWAEPRNFGAEFGAFVPQFVLEVEPGAGDAFDVRIGTAREGQQDACNPTTLVPASSEYPAVRIGPSAVDVHIVHETESIQVTATIFDLTLSDVLPDGGERSRDGELTGTMDLRQLYSLFTLLGPGRTADTLCTALTSLGNECAPCPSDGQAYCLSVRALYFGAEAVPMALMPIDADGLDATCFD